jgi:hypothetical protein
MPTIPRDQIGAPETPREPALEDPFGKKEVLHFDASGTLDVDAPGVRVAETKRAQRLQLHLIDLELRSLMST